MQNRFPRKLTHLITTLLKNFHKESYYYSALMHISEIEREDGHRDREGKGDKRGRGKVGQAKERKREMDDVKELSHIPCNYSILLMMCLVVSFT